MDLILVIIISIIIFFIKIKYNKENIIVFNKTNNDGIIEKEYIKEDELKIGTNLMLRREPRAFHKILDDLGLN
jgi:5-hydroxyisourate hydrolase-like protein (transthyretin family)